MVCAAMGVCSFKCRMWGVIVFLMLSVCYLLLKSPSAVMLVQPSSMTARQKATLPQEGDKYSIEDIRKQWIIEPAAGGVTFKHSEGQHFSQIGQSEFVDDLLKGKRNGFYIECGAGDGMSLSNSLFFELTRGWSGLLVEANPGLFKKVVSRKRNAFVTNACLSPNNWSTEIEFLPAGLLGGALDVIKTQTNEARYQRAMNHTKVIKVQCFPLASILKSINVSHVDYFSLDVEGSELDILQTIPFDKIEIDVFTIEANCHKDYAEKIRHFFKSTGLYKEIKFRHCRDIVFQRL